jgi:hypothetical protein
VWLFFSTQFVVFICRICLTWKKRLDMRPANRPSDRWTMNRPAGLADPWIDKFDYRTHELAGPIIESMNWPVRLINPWFAPVIPMKPWTVVGLTIEPMNRRDRSNNLCSCPKKNIFSLRSKYLMSTFFLSKSIKNYEKLCLNLSTPKKIVCNLPSTWVICG